MSLECIRTECNEWQFRGEMEISDVVDSCNPLADRVIVEYCEECIELIEHTWDYVGRWCRLKMGDVHWTVTPKKMEGDGEPIMKILFTCEWDNEYGARRRR